jgi:CBS domain-containing protein
MISDTIASVLQSKGREIYTVTPDATVYDAIALMAQKGVAAILVISKRGTLDGIISTRDYGRKIVLQGRSSKDTRVQEVMTSSVVTVTPDTTVAEGLKIMTENRFRHLPVLEQHELVGVVSMGDLVSAVISDQAHTIDQLHSFIGGKYPG